MKRFLILFLLSFAFSACQTTQFKEEPSKTVQRLEDTPLVVAIPGLNIPFNIPQEQHFGHLTQILDKEGIPSIVALYDASSHRLTDVADLSSTDYSIATTRILPILDHACEAENEIRINQNLPPLKEVNLVTYSQGSVIALDLVKRLHSFNKKFNDFKEKIGDEWDLLTQDPEVKLFKNMAEDYIVIKNIRIQRQEGFDRDPDLKRFYEPATRRLAEAFNRFNTYLLTPQTIYPNTPVNSHGWQKGYPRSYSKTAQWLQENFREDGSIPLDFWLQYAEYDNLLDINFRFFSITGSFFGSPRANSSYFLIKAIPTVDKLVVGSATKQIEETRLGSNHQLETIKTLMEYEDFQDNSKVVNDFYFIVGANGEKGDGLVDQSSAHLSSHFLTQLSSEDFLKSTDLEKDQDTLFQTQRMPLFRVTGLPLSHLPENRFLYSHLGAAQIEDKSPVLPFLLAFLRKDFGQIERLHKLHNEKLRQFMVEVKLPNTDEFAGYDFALQPRSKEVRISKRIFNASTNTIVWTGVFSSRKNFLDFKLQDPAKDARVVFKISKAGLFFSKPQELEIFVSPGTNHFVEITSTEKKNVKALPVTLPSIFDLIPRKQFMDFVTGEK